MQLNDYVAVEPLPLPDHKIVTANPRETLLKARVIDGNGIVETGVVIAFFRHAIVTVEGKKFVSGDDIQMIVDENIQVA